MMSLKKIVFTTNFCLAMAMIVHVGIKMILHARHPEYSAPIYSELINAVYYLIPILIVNIVYFIIKK